MKIHQCAGVVGPGDLFRQWLRVRPQSDHDAVATVETRFHPRVKASHRGIDFGQCLSEIDFELCDVPEAVRGDPGDDVPGPQVESDSVRGVEDDRIVNSQTERGGGRQGRRYRTRDLWGLHLRTRDLAFRARSEGASRSSRHRDESGNPDWPHRVISIRLPDGQYPTCGSGGQGLDTGSRISIR